MDSIHAYMVICVKSLQCTLISTSGVRQNMSYPCFCSQQQIVSCELGKWNLHNCYLFILFLYFTTPHDKWHPMKVAYETCIFVPVVAFGQSFGQIASSWCFVTISEQVVLHDKSISRGCFWFTRHYTNWHRKSNARPRVLRVMPYISHRWNHGSRTLNVALY